MTETRTPVNYVQLGALVQDGGVLFRSWSSGAGTLDIVIEDGGVYPMEETGGGYFEAFVNAAAAGTRYRIRLSEDQVFPDPFSRFQPEGVHGPSMVVDPSRYRWSDSDWAGIPRERLVFYEVHVGAFSPEGNYDGVRKRLDYLRDLGITAIELMPVAEFPGRWNWGYDHAALFAPSRAYGSPDELRRLIDDAHGIGLSVFLDVIYNHIGPDGAYIAAFCPLFTDKHHTPWGSAINFDDTHSDGVRNLFIENALMWLREYHFDGLRLDATHAIVDDSETHFLEELKAAVEQIDDGPDRLIFAEDARNLNKIILPRARGGYGLDGVWTDDFHHQMRNLIAGDKDGYFEDFADTTTADVARTINRGWFFEGQLSRHAGKPRGTDASVIDPSRCVIAIQNHDQIGNRPRGDRLNHVIGLETYRAASALLLFAPELPLLFMGQEWAASTPFLFFTDHNEELGRLVSEGRKAEFGGFQGFAGDIPDPQDPDSFERSRLVWTEREDEPHAGMIRFYRDLLSIRTTLTGRTQAEALSETAIRVSRGPHHLLVSFSAEERLPIPRHAIVLLDSEDEKYVPNGRPTDVRDGQIQFHRPSAVILQTREDSAQRR